MWYTKLFSEKMQANKSTSFRCSGVSCTVSARIVMAELPGRHVCQQCAAILATVCRNIVTLQMKSLDNPADILTDAMVHSILSG